MGVSYEQARRFYAAIRSERLDIADATEIWAKGCAAGRLKIADDTPGFRHIEEIVPK